MYSKQRTSDYEAIICRNSLRLPNCMNLIIIYSNELTAYSAARAFNIFHSFWRMTLSDEFGIFIAVDNRTSVSLKTIGFLNLQRLKTENPDGR